MRLRAVRVHNNVWGVASAVCRYCAVVPHPDQLRLFDIPARPVSFDSAVVPFTSGDVLPAVRTSWCGRYGFWRERTPTIFGGRKGVGPLIVLPDTNVLIEFRELIAEAEGGNGFVVRPGWGEHPGDALQDLVQLWWWRDVRFWVGKEHLTDERRRMAPKQREIRSAAVDQMWQDFVERGRHETVVRSDIALVSRPCPLHSGPPDPPLGDESYVEARWPAGDLDRSLVRAALDNACHVFLTRDRGVLRRRQHFINNSLAIMAPTEMIAALRAAGELDDTAGIDAPAPDITALVRLYAAFAHDDV